VVTLGGRLVAPVDEASPHGRARPTVTAAPPHAAVCAEPPPPPPTRPAPADAWSTLPAGATRDWLERLGDDGHRRVLAHLAVYGAVTEVEVSALLGSPAKARRFAAALDSLVLAAPLTIGVETTGGIKRYVRETV
jgi:hypothetical protein